MRFAFENCLPEYEENRRRILRYLIPVEMNLFNFPSQTLLEKYNLTEYTEITTAVVAGDMSMFE